jgi:uncharacterized Fe-S center protein
MMSHPFNKFKHDTADQSSIKDWASHRRATLTISPVQKVGLAKAININGRDFGPVDVIDEDGAIMLPVKDGKHFKEMSVGKHMLNYDSMVMLTHFKVYVMGGFSGSLENIAIGCADGTIGKKMVHAAPDNEDFASWLKGEPFMESIMESAKATINHFGNRIVYINVLRNISVDCDCEGVTAAPTRCTG